MSQLSPEDEALIRNTYQGYLKHLAWVGVSLSVGVIGVAACVIPTHLTLSDPLVWILFIYAAALPAVVLGDRRKALQNFLMAPVVGYHEIRRRMAEVASSYQILKARFGRA